MKKSVGIDVSKATLDVCYKTAQEQQRHRVFDNTGKGHQQHLRWLKGLNETSLTELPVIIEATGVYHLPLAK